jgi:hypothetical protein
MDLKSNEEIFGKVALKQNPDFYHGQFKSHNQSLYSIIINSMDAAQRPLKAEIKRLKKLVDDDTDYKAMRIYAKELEHRLGINQESGK